MGVSEKKMKIVMDNYFKSECDVNTSIRNAFEKGFRIGVQKGQSAQPEQQWIPCSERLPEKELRNNAFLVTVQCEYEDGYPDYVVCGAEYTEEYGWEYMPYPCGAIKVVAWMPVNIEPYQAERREDGKTS